MKSMKLPKIIIIIGAVLIAARLFVPVLKCKEQYSKYDICDQGQVILLSFNQSREYQSDVARTVAQALGIGVVATALYVVLRKSS